MPARDWEDVFISLDFMQGATISKADLHDSKQCETASLQLHAYALDGQRLPVPLWEKADSWSFTLADFPLAVTDLVLEDGAGQEVLRIDELMPRTDKEFEGGFRSNSRRSQDPYLNFFIARQMALHFPGTVSYRISAIVVALYKAIEIRDLEYLDSAEALLRLAEDLLPLAPVARSPRKNREHLRVSIWCAEWHFRLVRGDFEGFLKSLQSIRTYMEHETLSSYFNAAYPANTSLSMLCFYLSAVGDRSEARSVMKLAFSLFQRSVRDADTNTAHFRELTTIHRATYECIKMVKRGRNITEADARNTLRKFSRISPTNHKESYQEMWETFRNGLALKLVTSTL